MDGKTREHVDELVRYVSQAGRSAYGTYPIDMTPMAYVAGALFALERVGALTGPERRESLARCHDAYGLKPVPEPPPRASISGTGHTIAAMAYKPEWADERPHPRALG